MFTGFQLFERIIEKYAMNRKCMFEMAGAAGAAFVTLLASAENIEKYLVGTAIVWMVGGAFLAACWAYEHFCRPEGGGNDEE